VATKTEEGEELSLQDMDGVFLKVPVLKEELSRGSPAPGREVSVPTLLSGSSITSPAPNSEERALEEKHLEEVLSLMQTELAKTKLQLHSAHDEITYLKRELSAQQERLLEAEKVIEFESVKAKTLSADKESLQTTCTVVKFTGTRSPGRG